MCETERHREAIRAARVNFRPKRKSVSGKKKRRLRAKERGSKEKESKENSRVLLFEGKKGSKSSQRRLRKKRDKRNVSASKLGRSGATETSRGKAERGKTERGRNMKNQFNSYLQKMSRISKQKSGKSLRKSRSGKLVTKIIGSQKFSILSNSKNRK